MRAGADLDHAAADAGHVPEGVPGRVPGWLRAGLPLAVMLGTVACFVPVLANGFVNWDDDINLTGNPRYRGLSRENLRWMFTTFHGGHYQPLTWTTFAVDHAVWGMDARGYHLTSLLLHTANALLVYALILVLIRRSPSLVTAVGELGVRLAAAVGALFFAVHPLRVESVAWATERRDVVSGFFYLLTLLTYLRAQTASESARRPWLVLSLGCFLFSLLSKAWGVTLPVILLVLDVYPLRRLARSRGLRRPLLEKVPYAVLAAGAAVLADRAARPYRRAVAEHGLIQRTAQAAYGLCFYLWKTIVPVRLSALYPLELALDPARPRYVIAALVVLGVTVFSVLARRRRPWASSAWFSYAVVLAPVLGFAQAGPQIAADRYTYLACLPWAILLAAGIGHCLTRSGWRRLVPVSAVLGIVLLGTLTFRQSRVWKSSHTLWNRVVEEDPSNADAYLNRGWARQREGDLAGAIGDFTRAIGLSPGFANAYYNRGTAWRALGNVDAAIADFSEAIRLNPGDAGPYNNRGNARLAKGDVDGAIGDFSEAIRIAPGFSLAYRNRAAARRASGDMEGAAEDVARGRGAHD